jgi:hypothetical protein
VVDYRIAWHCLDSPWTPDVQNRSLGPTLSALILGQRSTALPVPHLGRLPEFTRRSCNAKTTGSGDRPMARSWRVRVRPRLSAVVRRVADLPFLFAEIRGFRLRMIPKLAQPVKSPGCRGEGPGDRSPARSLLVQKDSTS